MKIQFYTKYSNKEIIPEPVPASKVVPKWFSDIQIEKIKSPIISDSDNIKELERNRGKITIKKCPGVQEILKTGYVIRSWADFIFREEDGFLYVNWVDDHSDHKNGYSLHGMNQIEGIPNAPLYGGFHKIISPWTIKTEPGISVMIMDAFWQNKSNFTSVQGIVHTDVSPLQLHWMFEWNYKIKTGMSTNIDVDNQLVKYGDPLFLVIPFRRQSFEMECNYVSEEEWARMNGVELTMLDDKVASKCPYVKFRQTIGNLFR